MEIPLSVIGIYIFMVLFGLFAYAVIIPYFVVRRFRKMAESGEIAQMLGDILPTLLEMRITVKDSEGQPVEMGVVNYLVAVAVNNLKMQLNSFKSAMVRGITGGDGEEGGPLDALLDSVPKKWRWAAQLIIPLVAQKLAPAAGQAPAQPSAVTVHYGGAV